MKTTMKTILVVVAMFGTLLNYANENEITLNLLKEKKVKVTFKEVRKGNTLYIKDTYGTVIYSQKIENSGQFSKVFDLSNLEKGNYTTELEKEFEIIVRKFSVIDGKVSFNEENKVFKPVVRAKNNVVLVSHLAFNKKPLKVVLYYKDEIIFSETIERNSKNIVNRAYRLQGNLTGEYKIVTLSEDKSYLNNVRI